MGTSARIRAPEAAAASPASPAVECRTSRARSASSSNVRVDKEIGILTIPAASGRRWRPGVSGVTISFPGAAHPSRRGRLGLDTVTDDTDRFPRWSRPKSGPEPSAIACSRLNRPGRSSSSGHSRPDAVERGKRADLAVNFATEPCSGVTGDGKPPHMTADPLHKVDKLSTQGGPRSGGGRFVHERERLNKDAEKMVGVPVGDEWCSR